MTGDSRWTDLFLQVHQFMVGVAPIRSLCRVGWAAKQLVSIPSDLLRTPTGQHQEVAVSRQLHRALAGFVRAVTLEALGLGATLAGGAQQLLGAPTAEEQPAGVPGALGSMQHCDAADAQVASTCAAAATKMAAACSCLLELWRCWAVSYIILFAAKIKLVCNQDGLQQAEGCLYVHRFDLTRARQPWDALCLSPAVLWPQTLLTPVQPGLKVTHLSCRSVRWAPAGCAGPESGLPQRGLSTGDEASPNSQRRSQHQQCYGPRSAGGPFGCCCTGVCSSGCSACYFFRGQECAVPWSHRQKAFWGLTSQKIT